MIDNSKEYIICAAIHIKNDNLQDDYKPVNIDSGIVITGLRHCNCFGTLMALGLKVEDIEKFEIIQGFLTSENRFLNRKESCEIAILSGQVNYCPTSLLSEDLY